MKGYGMLEVLKSRRAIRTYQDKMPDKDLIEKYWKQVLMHLREWVTNLQSSWQSRIKST